MKTGEFLTLALLIVISFTTGVFTGTSTTSLKMVSPVAVECDAACEFDKVHGKPNPPWLTETMQVVLDLGNYWWIVEETVSGECLLMYRRTATTGGTGKIGHFAVSTLNAKSCSRREIK